MSKESRHRVVVGVDESDASRAAVTWASWEAARTGAALHLVHTLREMASGDIYHPWYATDLLRHLDEVAQARLEDVASDVHRELPGVHVTCEVTHDPVRRALQRASRQAVLLVTGARRRTRLRTALGGLQLGSTSLFAAAHAECPVAVVRALPPADAKGVVVGDDGSLGARAAVAFAARQAAGTGEPLLLVRTWTTPTRRLDGWSPEMVEEIRGIEESAHRRSVDDTATELRARHPGLQVDVEVTHAVHPADLIVDTGRGARLIVLGARGHGAFLTALLGSVSHDVLHRAAGPVVVVPDPQRAAQHGAHGADDQS